MMDATAQSPADTTVIEASLHAVKRRLAIVRARKNLIPFIRLMMPDPEDPENPDKSQYEAEAHHFMLAEAVEKSEAGKLPRFGQSIPPQHGKSLILSRMGTAWKAGRDPYKHRIIGTYNADFAREIGESVQDIIRSPAFQQVFPGVTIAKNTDSKSDLQLLKDGRRVGSLRFRGRGESTTGRPADDFTIDDPYKDQDEANSEIIRRQCRKWYSSVVFSRTHKKSTIIIVHTRWHEDDLLGWLCDPDHPEHSKSRAKRWTYINVPAVITDPGLASDLGLALAVPTDADVIEAFGTKPMVALWAKKFPLEHLAEAHNNDPSVFSALYMGRPSPDEGEYFKAEMIVGYRPQDLPKHMRIYAASDHALTTRQDRDANCMGCIGVDENDHIWLLPDLYWERSETDDMVDAMLDQMRRHKPLVWWAARDHISKAIGPFLRTRQREEQIYTYVEESPETKDAKTRARAIQGRMSMQMVHFPTFAPWYERARAELLKFPHATHDDFVSFLSHIGMGMDRLVGGNAPKKRPDNVVRVGSAAWVKASSRAEQRARERRKAIGGM